jgi:hypothetical protein
MKIFCLFLSISFAFHASAQTDSSLVQAKLYLPAHITRGIPSTQSLIIYYLREDDSGKVQTETLVARKEKDNQYSFIMQPSMYFRMVFVAGEYSAQLFCVDNRKGKATQEYDFNILLEKKRFDPADLKFMAPCVVKEEE